MATKYIVHVERVIRLRVRKEWTYGPYRFKWYARIVAYMETYETDNIWQSAEIKTCKC